MSYVIYQDYKKIFWVITQIFRKWANIDLPKKKEN